MYGYERPGVRGTLIYRNKENPDYPSQTECIGLEAVVDGLRYSTLRAKLIAGPQEAWNAGYMQALADSTRLYKTESGRFFTVAAHRFVTLSETAARDVFGNDRQQHVPEAEAFGSETPLA